MELCLYVCIMGRRPCILNKPIVIVIVIVINTFPLEAGACLPVLTLRTCVTSVREK